MIRQLAAIGILVLMTLGSAEAQELRVGAGASATENIFKKIQAPLEKDTGLKLVVVDTGPVDALLLLDKGEVEAALGGVTFADWMTMMAKANHPVADPSIYKQRVIGKDISLLSRMSG